jgi:hypothetical protein
MYFKNKESGLITQFGIEQGDDWETPTQEEIDAFNLEKDRATKLTVLRTDFMAFCDSGFLYNGNTFCLKEPLHILEADAAGSNKFFDVDSVEVDFIDTAGFTAFKNALLKEKDRILKKYHTLKKQISDSQDPLSIAINFTA